MIIFINDSSVDNNAVIWLIIESLKCQKTIMSYYLGNGRLINQDDIWHFETGKGGLRSQGWSEHTPKTKQIFFIVNIFLCSSE